MDSRLPAAYRRGKVGLEVVKEAGAVVLRDGKVLLVRSNKKPHLWFFPKGHIELNGESAEETAIRELEEETGVVGYIQTKLNDLHFSREGADYEVEYYLVKYVGEIKAKEVRSCFWCPIPDAFHLLTFPDAKEILKEATFGCQTAEGSLA